MASSDHEARKFCDRRHTSAAPRHAWTYGRRPTRDEILGRALLRKPRSACMTCDVEQADCRSVAGRLRSSCPRVMVGGDRRPRPRRGNNFMARTPERRVVRPTVGDWSRRGATSASFDGMHCRAESSCAAAIKPPGRASVWGRRAFSRAFSQRSLFLLFSSKLSAFCERVSL